MEIVEKKEHASLSLDQNNYGKLTVSSDNSFAAEHWTGNNYQPAFKGLLVLDIQLELMQFLWKCCQEMLCGAPLTDDTLDWMTLDDINREAPYKAPAPFSLQRM